MGNVPMVMIGSFWTETQGVGRADIYLTLVCDQDSRIKLFHNFEKKEWTIVIILRDWGRMRIALRNLEARLYL